ncbi:MAG TPA: gephyrin-like molybdotransferase Glp, partial [Anaerolineae bacterium]|nr:gephyrin-like molybdotransferase Glp [Anaerolineae bacterium]
EPLPAFPRSTVDGYALRAADTHGASPTLPAYLTLTTEIPMGAAATTPLTLGQCQLIHTGGMLPPGADAVIMIEQTQKTAEAEIECLRPVAHGDNVIQIGEDITPNQQILPAGHHLRPADLGGLLALGLTTIPVTPQPTVAIISSGDELVPPSQPLAPGQIRDINSYTLDAFIRNAGGQPRRYPIIPDNPAAFATTARQALADNDVVIFTAGSSVSVRDLTAQTIDTLGPPGILVHGVNIRPGKPTILAVCHDQPVIGLPGNPVSALVIAELFVRPLLAHLQGRTTPLLRPQIPATLTLNLPSQSGREDWLPVRLIPTPDGYQAEPIFGKSNLIFTLARADGLLRIPPDATGLPAGEPVLITLLQ